MSIVCQGRSEVISNQRLTLFGGRVVRNQQIFFSLLMSFILVKTRGARAQCLGVRQEYGYLL